MKAGWALDLATHKGISGLEEGKCRCTCVAHAMKQRVKRRKITHCAVVEKKTPISTHRAGFCSLLNCMSG